MFGGFDNDNSNQNKHELDPNHYSNTNFCIIGTKLYINEGGIIHPITNTQFTDKSKLTPGKLDIDGGIIHPI